VYTDRL